MHIDNSARPEFSADTVMFDTVFTTIGSITKQLMVYNRNSDWLRIDEISLARGNSGFRLNIDGIQQNNVKDLEIPPDDSIYIFIEVTVDPNGSNNPMVIQDSITFRCDGYFKDIDLVAFGQDCHIFNGQMFNSQIWVNDKPYLIFNSMAVDTNQTLTVEAGCTIHFHRNSSMYILGTLKVNGTFEEPVTFRGDRLEHIYDDIPGQWGYIHLLAGSKNNQINYAVIKNGIIGLQVDTVVNANPTLTISNTRIENMSVVGLFTQEAFVKADNCLIANCGQYAVVLSIGGCYEFYHCTIANYWGFTNRSTPSLVLNNYYEDIYGNINIRPLEKAIFGNCIIYGNRDEEILLDEFPGTGQFFSYKFDHCLVRTDNSVFDNDDPLHFVDIIKNLDPNFVSTWEYDYRLDTLSPAKDNGDINIGNLFPLDINGISRIADGKPDIGAYERVE
jgi:hypothetical protein